MNAIVIFVRWIFSNIKKILLVLLLTVVFVVVLFPLGDLNDLISTQVSNMTQKQVYFQFDNMHLNPLTASLSLDNAVVDSPALSNLTIDSVSVSPALSNLYRKPGGTFEANGILKGDVRVEVSPSGDKSRIEITATNLSLKELRESASLPLAMSGNLNLSSQALADLTFAEQPEMDLNLLINNFEMPSGNVNLQQMGSIGLPMIQFDKVELKGKLAGGKFQIENGRLGSAKNEFYGDVKGEMSLTFRMENNRLIPIFGPYSLSLDLKATPDFQQRATLFLGFLDGYKVPGSSPANYKVTISAQNLMGEGLNIAPNR
jgi:type II secretion system protein N